MNSNMQTDFKSTIGRINYRDLMIFIVPILIFSLYLYIYNPGILTTASFGQLHQIASGQFNNSVPFLYTFIEMIFLKIFGSTLAIAFFQILVFAAIWTVICKYHRDDSAESSNLFVMEFAVTLIVCLIPINAVYSIALWSNILFAYAMLFLSFLIKVLIDRNGQMSMKFAIILAVTIAVTSQLSNVGIYIGIITLAAILVYQYMKNRNTDRTFLILPALAIVLILILGSLSLAYNVEDAHTNNAGGAPIVWSVLRGDDWEGQAYYLTADTDPVKDAQNKFYTQNKITPTESYEKLTSANLGKGSYNMVNSYAVYFKDHTLTDTLFNSPALYMYLAIILLVALQFVTKSKEMYLIYVPNIINIAGVFLTCPLNENRFLYPNLLIAYMLAIVFISIYFRGSMKSLPITLNTEKVKEPQQYQSGPAYDVSDNYFENQIEEAPLEMVESYEPPVQSDDMEYDSDLIDQILKEIEDEKQNKD